MANTVPDTHRVEALEWLTLSTVFNQLATVIATLPTLQTEVYP